MRRPSVLFAACALLASLFAGCAAQNYRPDYDPLEPVNRKIFWINDKLDVYFLEPVATGWEAAFNQETRRGISNFFQNLVFPVDMVNNLLQGKFKNSASSVGRFVVNTTVGFFGFLDPASSWGLERHRADLGQTLGVWGIYPGPYLVLPLWGPSNLRDTIGLAGDYALGITTYFVPVYYLLAATGVNTVNARSMVLKQIRDVRAAALDYYVFVRNAYFQRRKALVSGGTEVAEYEEDIYNVDTDNDSTTPENAGHHGPGNAQDDEPAP
jgi:phospholipid-binding lipoprotein MlaA